MFIPLRDDNPPTRDIDIMAIPAGLVLGLWPLLQILNVGMAGGVARFAHIGGFFAGLLLIRLALGGSAVRPLWHKS